MLEHENFPKGTYDNYLLIYLKVKDSAVLLEILNLMASCILNITYQTCE